MKKENGFETMIYEKQVNICKAFANPTFTSLLSPSGRPALLVTLFIPLQGAGQNEAGELVYYRELPP